LTASAIPVREKLELILNFLDHGSLYSAGGKKQSELRTRASELLSSLDQMERTYLTVGLAGGTGAGKSTIINALAAEEISSPSHRRPHTDRIILYRHQAAPAPRFSPRGIPFVEILHRRDSIRHILLCDLPDFDSIEEQHRTAVSSFLPKLDIVVWMTTPEKYADARFYSFIKESSRSHDNFLFVLNKVDLLFDDMAAGEGYERLSIVAAGLTDNLSKSGITGAFIYAVSALEALKGEFSAWNQFMSFRNLLFKHRDAKTVETIKTSNIETETSVLMAALQEEKKVVEASVATVLNIADELKTGPAHACAPPDRLSPPVMITEIHRRFASFSHDHHALMGPGYLVWLAAGSIKRALRGTEGRSPLPEPEETIAAFHRCIQWTRDRLSHQMMKKNIPEALRKRFTAILMEDDRTRRFRTRSKETISIAFQTRQKPSYRFFKIRQRLCYGFITVLLVIVLGGETAWLRLFSEPGISSLFQMFLAFTNTLFSAEGLAALASYGLMNIFFGFRFFNRHQKFLNRLAQEAARELENALLAGWNAALKETAKDLEEEANLLLSSVSAFLVSPSTENHK